MFAGGRRMILVAVTQIYGENAMILTADLLTKDHAFLSSGFPSLCDALVTCIRHSNFLRSDVQGTTAAGDFPMRCFGCRHKQVSRHLHFLLCLWAIRRRIVPTGWECESSGLPP